MKLELFNCLACPGWNKAEGESYLHRVVTLGFRKGDCLGGCDGLSLRTLKQASDK